MPVQRCTIGGRRGWKWGAGGRCYPGEEGKEKAEAQGRAIKASQSRSRSKKKVP